MYSREFYMSGTTIIFSDILDKYELKTDEHGIITIPADILTGVSDLYISSIEPIKNGTIKGVTFEKINHKLSINSLLGFDTPHMFSINIEETAPYIKVNIGKMDTRLIISETSSQPFVLAVHSFITEDVPQNANETITIENVHLYLYEVNKHQFIDATNAKIIVPEKYSITDCHFELTNTTIDIIATSIEETTFAYHHNQHNKEKETFNFYAEAITTKSKPIRLSIECNPTGPILKINSPDLRVCKVITTFPMDIISGKQAQLHIESQK